MPGGTAIRAEALRAALGVGRAAGRDLRFVTGGRSGELLSLAAGGVAEPGLWYLAPDGEGELEERLAAAEPAELDPEERLIALDFPGQSIELPVSGRLIVPVRHWLSLLWANLLGLGPALWGGLLSANPALAALKLIGGAARAVSLDPHRIAAALSTRGRGARVHHSAVVEASLIGPEARVEAGAVVRGCVLGAGAVVEALAVCEGAVLGPGATVQRQALLKFAVLGAGAQIGGATQLSVLGPGASLKRGAYGMDISLGGAVRVRFGGALAAAPLGMAGVCLGDGALVGSGVWIAPGRAVAPGVVVVRDAVLADTEVPGPGIYRVRGGGLLP